VGYDLSLRGLRLSVGLLFGSLLQGIGGNQRIGGEEGRKELFFFFFFFLGFLFFVFYLFVILCRS
jgi:hypothetical protein